MPTSPCTPPVIEHIRSAFPALASDTVFLENAGGAQVPAVVADAIRSYMVENYVQLDADYEPSRRATQTVNDAHAFAELLMNAGDRGRVILGASSTALCNMLAGCYRAILEPGDEVIVADSGHETNLGPWKGLASSGISVHRWPVDPAAHGCRVTDLERLLSPRTRIVAFPHVSNLLGEIADVPAITAAAHGIGAKVVVDGVAYAPHRAIDVSAWGVDWYFYSTYKVYGPHMACLYGTHEALAELTGPNHFFIPRDDVPYKFEPGGVNHESCAGLLALREYFGYVCGTPGVIDRTTVEDAFAIMEKCEAPLIERLLAYLRGRPDVRIIGPPEPGPDRVGTISFVHESRRSIDISRAVCAKGIGIRHGHMYAYHLCETYGLDPADGVVRVSLVHYNTVDEIERLIAALDKAMA